MRTKTSRAFNSGILFFICAAVFSSQLALSGCAGKKASLVSSRPYRVAVLPFDSANPYVPGPQLSDCFTVQLLRSVPEIQVIERKDLAKILQEQKLRLTGILKEEDYARLGSVLNVNSILIGSVQTLEAIQSVSGSISVTVKLLEVSTGKIVWADRENVSHAAWSVSDTDEIAGILMEKAAKKMVRRMGKNRGFLRDQARSEFDPAQNKLAYLRP